MSHVTVAPGCRCWSLRCLVIEPRFENDLKQNIHWLSAAAFPVLLCEDAEAAHWKLLKLLTIAAAATGEEMPPPRLRAGSASALIVSGRPGIRETTP